MKRAPTVEAPVSAAKRALNGNAVAAAAPSKVKTKPSAAVSTTQQTKAKATNGKEELDPPHSPVNRVWLDILRDDVSLALTSVLGQPGSGKSVTSSSSAWPLGSLATEFDWSNFETRRRLAESFIGLEGTLDRVAIVIDQATTLLELVSVDSTTKRVKPLFFACDEDVWVHDIPELYARFGLERTVFTLGTMVYTELATDDVLATRVAATKRSHYTVGGTPVKLSNRKARGNLYRGQVIGPRHSTGDCDQDNDSGSEEGGSGCGFVIRLSSPSEPAHIFLVDEPLEEDSEAGDIDALLGAEEDSTSDGENEDDDDDDDDCEEAEEDD